MTHMYLYELGQAPVVRLWLVDHVFLKKLRMLSQILILEACSNLNERHTFRADNDSNSLHS